MKHGGEDGVTILKLYREVIAHSVLPFHCTTPLDDAGLIKHTLGKGGLAASRTAQQGNVLDFVCLIYSHIKRV